MKEFIVWEYPDATFLCPNITEFTLAATKQGDEGSELHMLKLKLEVKDPSWLADTGHNLILVSAETSRYFNAEAY